MLTKVETKDSSDQTLGVGLVVAKLVSTIIDLPIVDDKSSEPG